jgi:hypothetical protein
VLGFRYLSFGPLGLCLKFCDLNFLLQDKNK